MAQFGQSARLGAVRSQVRILLSRFFVGNKPFLKSTRKYVRVTLCYLTKKYRKGDSAQAYFKINRLQIGLFFLRKILLHVFLIPPLYVFYNPIFDFSFIWKFSSDLMQICDFRKNIVSLFESPLGIIFQLEFSI